MKAAEAFHACEDKSQDANVRIRVHASYLVTLVICIVQCLSDKNDAPHAIQRTRKSRKGTAEENRKTS